MMTWKQAPSKLSTPAAKGNARKLRRAMTDAEKSLWKYLRGNFAGQGTHFRRQVPIGSYVADFCCLGHRLIVELDGPVHDTAAATNYDRLRDESLKAQGFSVLRFANTAVLLDFPSVLARVAAALSASTPTPNPAPQGGGEHPVPWRSAEHSAVHP